MEQTVEVMKEKVTSSNDDAINNYIDLSLEKVSKIIELLVEAEEAYSLSRVCEHRRAIDDDWRGRRDGLRAEGTVLLHKATELFNE